MTLQHRRAKWFGDLTKLEALSKILRDPVFAEAVELFFAESRTLSLDTRTTPAEMLMRQQCETIGAQMLLRGLENACRPLEDPSESMIAEWDHLAQDVPVQP